MKVHFFTLGCKTNTYESSAMGQSFIKKGYEIVKDKEEKADIYIINTCSVTNIAERKSRQMMRQAKELNPKATIVACGCYAQVAKDQIAQIDEVDLIIGSKEKNQIVEIIEEYLKNKNKDKEILISDIMNESEYQDFESTTMTELNRAVVKIQDGCDRFCAYCIIPYARGHIRSRNPIKIIEEIQNIAKQGIKEVVLTGIHLASYGKDFTDEKAKEYRKQYNYSEEYKKYTPNDDLASGGFRLIELLEQINKIDGIERIRLGSIEPKLITEEFVSRLSKLEKICHHFHLSLQSGCNETLKRMNRRYTTEDFRAICKILRAAYKDVIFTTDIIVGFPGETEEEFKQTYEFLKEIKMYKMHIFKYSPKRGTAATKFKNQIDSKIKDERSKILLELSDKNEIEYNETYINKTVTVLFEEAENGYFKGHTGNYLAVKVKTDKDLTDKLLKVKIDKLEKLELVGTLV